MAKYTPPKSLASNIKQLNDLENKSSQYIKSRYGKFYSEGRSAAQIKSYVKAAINKNLENYSGRQYYNFLTKPENIGLINDAVVNMHMKKNNTTNVAFGKGKSQIEIDVYDFKEKLIDHHKVMTKADKDLKRIANILNVPYKELIKDNKTLSINYKGQDFELNTSNIQLMSKVSKGGKNPLREFNRDAIKGLSLTSMTERKDKFLNYEPLKTKTFIAEYKDMRSIFQSGEQRAKTLFGEFSKSNLSEEQKEILQKLYEENTNPTVDPLGIKTAILDKLIIKHMEVFYPLSEDNKKTKRDTKKFINTFKKEIKQLNETKFKSEDIKLV